MDRERFKYLAVECKSITVDGLLYKFNGNKKRTYSSVLYEYELVK